MSRWLEAPKAFAAALALAFACAPAAAGTSQYPGVGRTATAAEIAAWDIDVRADFQGLPKGSGSVAKGQQVWEGKCASCHGIFGESNEVFPPLVGGTTAEDIRTGRVKALTRGDMGRTTLMKLAKISTLWDYVNRAMPWNAPKSLSTEEVYAVVAYMLHLGDILPADFVLSDANIAEVQKRLPNRGGMTTAHGLWDVKGKPDVANVACMKDCAGEVKVASALPTYARDAHGNLAEQHRMVGAVRGLATTGEPAMPDARVQVAGGAKPVHGDGAASVKAASVANLEDLARRKACLSCHGVDKRLVGPAFTEVASRYQKQSGAEEKLLEKLRRGSSGAWGPIPMPPQPDLAEKDARSLVRWILEQQG